MSIVQREMEITLKYSGPDVDDGTMSVEDMIPALQGFSSAYGKIVNADELQVRHKMRVVGIRKGSFDILIQILGAAASAANGTPFQIDTALGKVAIEKIVGVIKITKHVKNQAYDTKINSNNGTIHIINVDKLSVEVPYEIYDLFHQKTIQQDISKIAKPLEAGKIDSTEIEARGDDVQIHERIAVEEKPYFDSEAVAITKTDMTEITGFFLSIYKTTNRGYFILSDGTRVSYRLVIPNPEVLWPLIIHKGAVRVRAVVHMDGNLKPTVIDVYEIEPLQGTFEFPEEKLDEPEL
jgi:hypothetical protein